MAKRPDIEAMKKRRQALLKERDSATLRVVLTVLAATFIPLSLMTALGLLGMFPLGLFVALSALLFLLAVGWLIHGAHKRIDPLTRQAQELQKEIDDEEAIAKRDEERRASQPRNERDRAGRARWLAIEADGATEFLQGLLNKHPHTESVLSALETLRHTVQSEREIHRFKREADRLPGEGGEQFRYFSERTAAFFLKELAALRPDGDDLLDRLTSPHREEADRVIQSILDHLDTLEAEAVAKS